MNGITVEELKRLPVNDRLALLEAVWDSLVDAPGALKVTEAQRAELDRRIARLDRDPASVETWETVRAYVRDRGRKDSKAK
jgi:putative addiction module component (TIGR02574 family)